LLSVERQPVASISSNVSLHPHSYASAPGGSYAFVLYYRIPRTAEAEEALGRVHNAFAELAVGLGGSFYLPYRKCYSPELLERAYPMVRESGAGVRSSGLLRRASRKSHR